MLVALADRARNRWRPGLERVHGFRILLRCKPDKALIVNVHLERIVPATGRQCLV